MFGYVEWNFESHTVHLQECRVLKLPFCCVSIPRSLETPEFLARLRCRRAAAKLRGAGICRAVFPERFPYMEEFARRGVFPVDPLPLHRAMAAELTAAVMRERGLSPASAIIGVCAEDLTLEVRRCVTTLCVRCRYVTLSCRGARAFSRELRGEYGAVLVASDDPRQLSRAEILIRFCPREDVPPGENELQLYAGGKLPEVEFRLAGECGGTLPQDVSCPQLFSVLYTTGILRPEDVEIAGKSGGA